MNYKERYINRMWEAIKEVDIKGSFPSVIIAQGALESDWGRSQLATQYNNYLDEIAKAKAEILTEVNRGNPYAKKLISFDKRF